MCACVCHWIKQHSHNRKFDITIVDIYAAYNNVIHMFRIVTSRFVCVLYPYKYEFKRIHIEKTHEKSETSCINKKREKKTDEMRY